VSAVLVLEKPKWQFGTMEAMTIADPKTHHFTLAEFEQMSDAGLFQDQRVELIAGDILDMAPQNEPHVYTVSVVNRFCRGIFRTSTRFVARPRWLRQRIQRRSRTLR
jgi:hypothetical protein